MAALCCKYLSLDETCLSNGELYTILTNKNAQDKKDAIVAIVKGTKASDVIHILPKTNSSTCISPSIEKFSQQDIASHIFNINKRTIFSATS